MRHSWLDAIWGVLLEPASIDKPDGIPSGRPSSRVRVRLVPSPKAKNSSFRSLASKGSSSGYSKSVCVRLHSENSEPTMFSQTTPDEHPPKPPPCRWPALVALPTLDKFKLVWRRLCDVLFPYCLVEHTLTAVCVLPH